MIQVITIIVIDTITIKLKYFGWKIYAHVLLPIPIEELTIDNILSVLLSWNPIILFLTKVFY